MPCSSFNQPHATPHRQPFMDNQQCSSLAPESKNPLCDGTTTSTLASSVSQPPSTEKPSGDDSDNRASAELTSSTTSDHDKRTSAEITSTTTSVQDNRTSSTPGENGQYQTYTLFTKTKDPSKSQQNPSSMSIYIGSSPIPIPNRPSSSHTPPSSCY